MQQDPRVSPTGGVNVLYTPDDYQEKVDRQLRSSPMYFR